MPVARACQARGRRLVARRAHPLGGVALALHCSVGRASVPAITRHPSWRVSTVLRAGAMLTSMAEDSGSQVRRYRHRLPHWRMQAATYFVTWRLRSDQPELTSSERSLIVEALRHFDGQRYHLDAFVVMDDHVHVVLRLVDDTRLERVLHSWKSFTANQLQRIHGRAGAIWQDEYFDRIVRDEAELQEKMQYVLNNPRQRWPEIESYSWVWTVGVDPES